MRSLTIWLMVIAFFAAAVEVSISPQPSFRVALEDLCLSLWDNGLDLCGPRPAESGDVEEGGGGEPRPVPPLMATSADR
jgi:hypothetical protein